jgi:hypothetical protein
MAHTHTAMMAKAQTHDDFSKLYLSMCEKCIKVLEKNRVKNYEVLGASFEYEDSKITGLLGGIVFGPGTKICIYLDKTSKFMFAIGNFTKYDMMIGAKYYTSFKLLLEKLSGDKENNHEKN